MYILFMGIEDVPNKFHSKAEVSPLSSHCQQQNRLHNFPATGESQRRWKMIISGFANLPPPTSSSDASTTPIAKCFFFKPHLSTPNAAKFFRTIPSAVSSSSSTHFVSGSSNWAPESWKSKKALQLPEYPDADELESVLRVLESFPPIVFAGEARKLEESLAKAAVGEAFLLQGGDCAESFKEFYGNNIRDTFRVLLQMGIVLTYGAQMPIIKVYFLSIVVFSLRSIGWMMECCYLNFIGLSMILWSLSLTHTLSLFCQLEIFYVFLSIVFAFWIWLQRKVTAPHYFSIHISLHCSWFTGICIILSLSMFVLPCICLYHFFSPLLSLHILIRKRLRRLHLDLFDCLTKFSPLFSDSLN